MKVCRFEVLALAAMIARRWHNVVRSEKLKWTR